jgi:hypothetical protein
MEMIKKKEGGDQAIDGKQPIQGPRLPADVYPRYFQFDSITFWEFHRIAR